MAYKVKVQLPCKGCGVPTDRRIRGRRTPQCLACSIRAVEVNAYDQHYARGENYQRWLAGMERAIARGGRAREGSDMNLDVKSLD